MENENLTPNQIAEMEASNNRIKELGIDITKATHKDETVGLDRLAERLGLFIPKSECSRILRLTKTNKKTGFVVTKWA